MEEDAESECPVPLGSLWAPPLRWRERAPGREGVDPPCTYRGARGGSGRSTGQEREPGLAGNHGRALASLHHFGDNWEEVRFFPL